MNIGANTANSEGLDYSNLIMFTVTGIMKNEQELSADKPNLSSAAIIDGSSYDHSFKSPRVNQSQSTI